MSGRRPLTLLPIAAVLSVSLGGCGDSGGGASELAGLAPPDAPLYLEVAVFPDDERSEAIASLTDRIGGIADPEAEVASLIDQAFEAETLELSYAEDIQPWLGDTAAVFVRSFEPADAAAGMIDAAYMVSVSGPDAAQAFLDELVAGDSGDEEEEREYEGTTYMVDPVSETAVGLVGDNLVIGTDPAFRAAVDASAGDSLADSEDFSEESGSLDDENLLEVWLDLGTALDAAAAASADTDGAQIDAARAALEPLLSEPIAVTLSATPDSVALETSAAGDAGVHGNTELLGQMPADSWFALAIEEAGAALRESLAGIGALGAEVSDASLDPEAIAGGVEAATGLDLEDDLLAWIGNAAFFVSGTSESELRVGGLLETSDPDATTAAVDAARDLFESQTGASTRAPSLEGATEGFAAAGDGDQGVEVALRDDLLVAAFGGSDPAAELVDADDSLADAESYSAAQEALGDDFEAAMFVAIQDFLVVAEQGDDGDTDYDAVRPYTEALEYLILGTAQEDGRERTRIVLGIGD